MGDGFGVGHGVILMEGGFFARLGRRGFVDVGVGELVRGKS
jgi:hypothetical protein